MEEPHDFFGGVRPSQSSHGLDHLAISGGIVDDRREHAAEPPGDLLVRDHDGGAGRRVGVDVQALVAASVRIRDQDHGDADGAHLAQRAGAGPADDQVGDADAVGEVTGEGERLVARRCRGGQGSLDRLHGLDLARTRLVHDREVGAIQEPGQNVRQRLVEAMRPLAAAQHQDGARLCGEVVPSTPEFRAHRCARHHRRRCTQETRGFWIGGRNRPGETGEDSGRAPRHQVLLLEDDRHASEAGRRDERNADVAARPEDDVRLEPIEQPPGLIERRPQHHRQCPVAPQLLGVEGRGGDGGKGHPVTGNRPRLDPLAPPREQDGGVRFFPRQRLCDGDRREQVSARAAARDQYSHAVSIPPSRSESRRSSVCRPPAA